MRNFIIFIGRLAFVPLFILPVALFAQAQEPVLPAPGQSTDEPASHRKWTDTLSFSLLSSYGNHRGYGFGLANGFHYRWSKYTVGLNLGATRLSNSNLYHYAVINNNGYDIYESRPPAGRSQVESSYHFSAQLARKATRRFTEILEAGWNRDRFAGINNRYTFFVGAGYLWTHSNRASFRTEISAGYIYKDLIYNNLHRDKRGFPALRIGYVYTGKITSRTTFNQEFRVIDNLRFAASYSLSLHNALTHDFSKKLALKAGFDFFYTSFPPFQTIDLLDGSGAIIGAVPYKLQKLNSNLSVKLLVRF